MTKLQRIEAFAKLGEWMTGTDADLQEFIRGLYVRNPWYTEENVKRQLVAIGENLTRDKLTDWLDAYPDFETQKSVGLVLAGNLPLVGFHDILCVLALGFTAKIKASSDDAGLTAFVLDKLLDIEPRYVPLVQIVEKLTDFDLVIATGSNNSARYFEYYFGKKPHIIRKNRNSVAVLSGRETSDELAALGHDIFDYYGLGCRSVSKLFIPKGYDVAQLFEAIEQYSTIGEHFKYHNNYEYNKSIYLINGDKHYDNGFVLLKEDEAMASPLAVLYFEEYDYIRAVTTKLNDEKEHIQCVVASADRSLNLAVPVFPLGQSQCPALDDYADHINTLEFLYENR